MNDLKIVLSAVNLPPLNQAGADAMRIELNRAQKQINNHRSGPLKSALQRTGTHEMLSCVLSSVRPLNLVVRRRSLPSPGGYEMKKVVVSLLAILPPLLATAAEGALFRTTFNMVSGRPLMPTTVTVEEVDRTNTLSIIEVSTGAGDAKLASEAALLGLCGLARHRGERYIQAKPIAQSPLTLEVSFPKVGSEAAAPPTSAMAPNVFPVASCPSNP